MNLINLKARIPKAHNQLAKLKFKFFFCGIVLVSICIGCSSEEPQVQPQLVIEGRIENGGFPDVTLTYSIVPDDGESITDKLIRWGKITVSDGTTTEILTGSSQKGFIPPYHYYGHTISGTPGKTYTIRAEYNGKVVTSSVKMPKPTKIDEIIIKPVEGVDSLRQAIMYFTSPENCPAYYYLSIRKNGYDEQLLPCFLGVVGCFEPNKKISIGVFNPKTYNTKKYEANLKRGESYIVCLNRVSEAVYKFRLAYNDMIAFSHNPFLSSSQSLPSNVDGGLGVWSAQGCDKYLLKVE